MLWLMLAIVRLQLHCVTGWEQAVASDRCDLSEIHFDDAERLPNFLLLDTRTGLRFSWWCSDCVHLETFLGSYRLGRAQSGSFKRSRLTTKSAYSHNEQPSIFGTFWTLFTLVNDLLTVTITSLQTLKFRMPPLKVLQFLALYIYLFYLAVFFSTFRTVK